MAAQSLRFLLSNTYGHPNIGDEAIVIAMLHELHNHFANARFSFLTSFPDLTQTRHPQVHAVHSQVFRGNRATLKVIKESDLLIIGGGGIIQDFTSLGNLLFHLSRAAAAYRLGTPFMCYAVGVGPLHSRVARCLTATVLKKAQAITVRDDYSAELLLSIGIPGRLVTVTADPVMTLPFASEANNHPVYQAALKAKQTAPLIAISLRPILEKYHVLRGKYTVSDTTVRLIEHIRVIAENLKQSFNAQFLFASMHPKQDDPIGHMLAKALGPQTSFIMAPGDLSPQTMMAIMGLSDLLIGMRLHSLILASRSAVPMIALSYAPKVSGFLSLLGQENQIVGPDDWSVEKIGNLANVTWAKRAEIRAQIEKSVPHLQARAEQNVTITKSVINNLTPHAS